MPRPARPLAALAMLATSAALLAPKHAIAQEREWHFGGSFGYSSFSGVTAGNGFGGGLHLAYGINDMFRVIADVDGVAHLDVQWAVVSGGVGAAYLLDVLRWEPWIGAEIGPAAALSTDPACGSLLEPCAAFRLNLSIPFGLDYRISQHFSVGAGGRFQMILLGDSPWTLVGAFARAEYVWGGAKRPGE